MPDKPMDKQARKALLAAYKEIKTVMGVICVTNTRSGKTYVAAYPNLKNKWLTLRAQLNGGTHANAALQQEWTAYGESAFTYDVLEEKTTDKVDDVRLEMKRLDAKWKEALQPYGERGYHKAP